MMCRICAKLARLSFTVFVTDKRKDTSLLQNLTTFFKLQIRNVL
jgi:hypothetical protein